MSISQLINSNEIRYRICRHAIFWLMYIIGYSFIGIDTGYGLFGPFMLAIRWLPFTALNTYVILYWLVERYLLRLRYRTFFLLLAAWTAVGVFLAFLTHLYLVYPYCWEPGPRPSFRQALPEIFDIYPIFVCNVVTGFAVFLRLYKFWRIELLQKLQLKQGKTDAELELLKAQLHPHFLFNTLNNLYTLILEKSPRAPEMLLRLSGILNYVLNDCQGSEVSLKKEIAFCQDYIDLEKERYGDRLDVVTNFSGDLESRTITPMLFQPFIENALKHGAAEQLGKVWINIELTIHNNELSFRVINSAGFSAQSSPSGGIGIANILRRLQLLYPGRHRFARSQEAGLHSISLTIDLTSATSGRSYRVSKKGKPLVAGLASNFDLAHN